MAQGQKQILAQGLDFHVLVRPVCGFCRVLVEKLGLGVDFMMIAGPDSSEMVQGAGSGYGENQSFACIFRVSAKFQESILQQVPSGVFIANHGSQETKDPR